MFFRSLLLMGVLLKPADEGAPGGSGAAPPAAAPAAEPAKPPAAAFSQDDVNRIVKKAEEQAASKAAKAVFAKLKAAGVDVDDDDKLVEIVKTGEEARKAKQGEIERVSEEAKTAKKRADEHAADLASQRAENAKLRVMLEAKPADVELFDALYDKASKEAGFDAKAWIAEQKTKRPALFEGASAASSAGTPAGKAATTTTAAGAGTQTTAGNGARRDAMRMTGEELRTFEAELGISR